MSTDNEGGTLLLVGAWEAAHGIQDLNTRVDINVKGNIIVGSV